MAAVSLGTETDGSILCPSNYNSETAADAFELHLQPLRQEGAIGVDNLKIAIPMRVVNL
ncbi:hypothetical protein ACOSQ3_005895 [Xanthoceras sorbifolium]